MPPTPASTAPTQPEGRIAFHTPLKLPDDPRPSGDRRMARLLMQALSARGFDPVLASRSTTRLGAQATDRQAAVIAAAVREADALIAAWRDHPPGAWITYHSYYKAPDLLGPRVSAALDIPYILIEASHATKRLMGPYQPYATQAEAAIRHADLILQPNPEDIGAVEPLLKAGAQQLMFPAFLDIAPYAQARQGRGATRAALAQAHAINPDSCWLIAAAMMRSGSKQSSYALLADALSRLGTAPEWTLLVAGDGPAEAAVRTALGPHASVKFLGRLEADALAALYAAGDLFVWPALKEAYGFALLEAQAAGLPALIGDRPGPRSLVAPGESAALVPEGDAAAFATALGGLLHDSWKRAEMGVAAQANCAAHHDLGPAAARLHALLGGLGVAPSEVSPPSAVSK